MLRPSVSFPLDLQIKCPMGFWSHAGISDFCKRMPLEMRAASSCGPSDADLNIPDSVIQGFIEDSKRFASSNDCGPSDVNGATLCSDSVVPGPGVRIPDSVVGESWDVNHVDVDRVGRVRFVDADLYVSILVDLFKNSGVNEFSIFQNLADTCFLCVRVARDSKSKVVVRVFHPDYGDGSAVVPLVKAVGTFRNLVLLWDFARCSVSCNFHPDSSPIVRSIIRKIGLLPRRALPGPGVRIPAGDPYDGFPPALAHPIKVRPSKPSTLDLTGLKHVRKGVLVSWGGLRFTVLRVEGGRAYYGEAFSNSVACGLVQVVA